MRISTVSAVTVAGIMCALSAAQVLAQVNSGSDGHDGALNPTANLVIDMHDHPDGIYQYTSVNIPSGVTVSFVPNAANTPVVWLVQQNCTIAGTLSVQGLSVANGVAGAQGGPGGFRGGTGSLGTGIDPGPGFGPGGGKVSSGHTSWAGGNGSYGTVGAVAGNAQHPSGDSYGTTSLLPLIGGSGGGGGPNGIGGGAGGGGAILIAVSGTLGLTGSIAASGGSGSNGNCGGIGGGGGSGGAVRLVASSLAGGGSISCVGGPAYYFGYPCYSTSAGKGLIRLEAFSDMFNGGTDGVVARGLQSILLFPSNQQPSLAITSVAGISVSANPAGQLATPDVVIPANQSNPITIVVTCQNIPLNSTITVDIKPANGAGVSATGQNSTGTVASSTAAVSVNMPSGGGTIQARTTANLGLSSAHGGRKTLKKLSLFETGLAMNGERFKVADIRTTLGGRQELVFVTESGKRIAASATGPTKLATTRPG